MIRALLLTDADVFAGTERLIIELASCFPAAGVLPTIGCPILTPLAEHAEKENIEVLPIGMRRQAKGGLADWYTLARLRSCIRKGCFDIIHVHNGRSAIMASLAGAGSSVPLVMSQHFLRPSRTNRRGMKRIVSNCIHQCLEKRISLHIAISEAVKQATIQHGVAPSSKIQVVLNGVRLTSPVSPALPCTNWPQNELQDTLVFSAARAEPEKDLPTLIKAIQSALKYAPNVRCAIAGGGRELKSIEQLVDSLDLSGRVKLLGFRRDVAELMAACSVFVLPALAEPFGLVVVEAMAQGKPVIACNAGGPSEIVLHGVTGLLVPPNDPEAMGIAIAELLNDAHKRSRMGAAGAVRYQEQFTADAMSSSVANLYRKVLDGWRVRR